MIKQVFMTDDGMTFDTREAAEVHEIKLVRMELIEFLYRSVDQVDTRRMAGNITDKLLETYTIVKK